VASFRRHLLRAGNIRVRRSRTDLEACGQLTGFFEHQEAASIRAAGASEASGAPRIDTGNSFRTLVEWCTARARTGLGVIERRGRHHPPCRGGDGEAVETSQVGVGDQPGLPVALLELDRWKSPRLAVG
jgi:hypothetical protein